MVRFLLRRIFEADGKKDLLAAVHCAGRGHGAASPAVVEPRPHLAAAGAVLVGCVQERMV